MYSKKTVVITWLLENRFFLLCLAIFGLMSLHTRNGQWHGDFWEHCAVIRELSTHFFQPKHPQLLLDSPHAFYSPYSVFVALFARTFHLDPITALSIMGLVNLCLWFLGIWLFVCSAVPNRQKEVAFYTLLLTLFFWGSDPWNYSGFFHIGVMGNVLPYPSTFSAALSLIALGLNWIRIQTDRQIWLTIIFLISVVVLISHPITFLFCSVGFLSQALVSNEKRKTQLYLAISLISLSFAAVAFWPYFPVIELFMDQSNVYNASNHIMYREVLKRIWPSLFGVPLLLFSQKGFDRCSPILIMFIMLSGIYIFGFFLGKYAYGRVISYIVLLLHVSIAEYISMLDSRIQKAKALIPLKNIMTSAIVVLIAVFLSRNDFRRVVDSSLTNPTATYKSYIFLSRFIPQYEIVLSDIKTSWIVPSFGGKVVATAHPLAFVEDQSIRKSDLEYFFNEDALIEERLRIIRKYDVKHLLIKKVEGHSGLNLDDLLLETKGKVIFENEKFLLISFTGKGC